MEMLRILNVLIAFDHLFYAKDELYKKPSNIKFH